MAELAYELAYEIAEEQHLEELIREMRELDRQEVEAASGDVARALQFALEMSDRPLAARAPDGGLVAVFGVVPMSRLSDTAAIWLLGTDRMRAHPRAIIADTRAYVEFVREQYPRLVNYIDARNRPSIAWLRLIGFQIDPPAPFGVAGLPFHKFHMGLD